jgi:hypothetical protein
LEYLKNAEQTLFYLVVLSTKIALEIVFAEEKHSIQTVIKTVARALFYFKNNQGSNCLLKKEVKCFKNLF